MGDKGGEAVRVAVRCRPFNSREKERGAKCVIEMKGSTTKISNPETPNEEPKQFTFDYSYWSHDGYEELADGWLEAKPGTNYASQTTVFNDLGKGVLKNAFDGFNCSLFAYGQTGSGKSFSMVGYGKNRGIVPITCDELFKTMAQGDPSTKYQITFSMLEIYNEQVRDLLQKQNPKGGLPVKENPKLAAFYVQGLKNVAVANYKDIEKRIEEGTANRTVASTNMNATSSRAHTVVTIIFDQISKNESGQETKKTSIINLVDLAGSERADSTGATGDRLKEGANINKSLSALGNVISALADLSTGKNKKIMVPYRDSVLTKLLKNALGGNSKTIMIAALSPADINYDETLGTLRYADRAKKIKNKAVVNENPLDKLIRELREENDRLKKLSGGGVDMGAGTNMTPEEREKMRKEMEEEIRAQLLANQEAMMNWDDRLKESQEETQKDENVKALEASRKNKEPHIMNLNEDPLLSGMVIHFLGASETSIGRKDAEVAPTIALSGLSIQKQHAVVTNNSGEVLIKPAISGAKIKVNGQPLTGARTLEHMDRILFGSNHMYLFKNPLKPDVPEGLPKSIDWEFAQREIAEAKGFSNLGSGLSRDQQKVQEQVMEILPMVGEANALSEELNKHKSFEVILLNETNLGLGTGGGKDDVTKVCVKMKDLLNGNIWIWERGKFMNRRFLMQDMYQKWLDGDVDPDKIAKEEDPFWEPLEDVLIGTANVFLQSLAYALDFDDSIAVTDYKGNSEGTLSIVLTPCTQQGKGLPDEDYIEDPQELLGKPYHFKVMVRGAEVNKTRFSKGLKVKYRCFAETEFTETPMLKNTLSPEWKHQRIMSYPSITNDHIEYFENSCLTFLLYATQEDSTPDPRFSKMTTKELRQMETLTDAKPALNRRTTSYGHQDSTDEGGHLKSELLLVQRKYEKLAKKEMRLQKLCEEWTNKPLEEQQFAEFHRAVSAVAFSSGNRWKSRVQVLQQVIKGHKNIKEKKGPKGNSKVIKAANADSGGGTKNGNGNGGNNNVSGSKACAMM